MAAEELLQELRLTRNLRLTENRFTLSTADEERNVVTDLPTATVVVRPMGVQPGQYRVIDGTLCRIVDALPASWPTEEPTSGT